MKPNIIKTKSFDFSVSIIQFCAEIQKNEREFVISKQLLRSATSVSANISESQDSYSRKEFAFKLQLSLKEARESMHWLELIHASKIYTTIEHVEIENLISQCNEIIAILVRIVKSVKSNPIDA